MMRTIVVIVALSALLVLSACSSGQAYGEMPVKKSGGAPVKDRPPVIDVIDLSLLGCLNSTSANMSTCTLTYSYTAHDDHGIVHVSKEFIGPAGGDGSGYALPGNGTTPINGSGTWVVDQTGMYSFILRVWDVKNQTDAENATLFVTLP